MAAPPRAKEQRCCRERSGRSLSIRRTAALVRDAVRYSPPVAARAREASFEAVSEPAGSAGRRFESCQAHSPRMSQFDRECPAGHHSCTSKEAGVAAPAFSAAKQRATHRPTSRRPGKSACFPIYLRMGRRRSSTPATIRPAPTSATVKMGMPVNGRVPPAAATALKPRASASPNKNASPPFFSCLASSCRTAQARS
jgi:hypothetical protein